MIIFTNCQRKGERIFIINAQIYDKPAFMERLGVEEGSYASELGERMYEALFCEAIDIVDEYEKYYKSEYASVLKYLASEYGLEMSVLNTIEKQLSDKPHILCADIGNSCEGHLAQYMLSERMKDTLKEILNGWHE